MTKAIVGTWGKSLATRIPADVARAVGLTEGDAVEIAAVNGEIVIRRNGLSEEQRRKGMEAVAAIRELRKGMRLDGLSIRDMIDEGRR